jgi:hypothetical protein
MVNLGHARGRRAQTAAILEIEPGLGLQLDLYSQELLGRMCQGIRHDNFSPLFPKLAGDLISRHRAIFVNSYTEAAFGSF